MSQRLELLLHHRYTQLLVMVLAGGAIYPLLYLRQNFELSLLDAYGMTTADLARCYSMLGLIFVLTYLPSGWLADRVPTRVLVSGSLVATGLLGLWFATIPSVAMVQLIFMGWGIATGFTFWAAMIKSVALIAPSDRQGTYFGILDGGRGAVEAAMATVAIALFAATIGDAEDNTVGAMRAVVMFYSITVFVLAPITLFSIRTRGDTGSGEAIQHRGTWVELKILFGNRRLWLAAFAIFAGYQVFWTTYTFSAYLQNHFALTAVTAGTLTVAKLWMRPIGALIGGLVADKLDITRVLAGLILASSLLLLGFAWLPGDVPILLALALVLVLGLFTYGIRGVYWATLEHCDIPLSVKGLAIGLISFIGYLPDVLAPMLQGALLTADAGKAGYQAYFGIAAGIGCLGALAAWRLHRYPAPSTKTEPTTPRSPHE